MRGAGNQSFMARHASIPNGWSGGRERFVAGRVFPRGRCYHRIVLLAHLSDIHLRSDGGLRPWHLLGKRLTGAVHLYATRVHHHQQEVVEAALRRIEELGCAHVVVTGDLSNLAIEAEFSHVADFLASSVGGRDRLSVIPGNHDRYTIDSLWSGAFDRHFSEPIATDLPDLPRRGAWPYVRLLDQVALIGVDSAIPLPPFLCGGWVGRRQIEAVRAALEHPEVANRCRVVLLHHPLFRSRSPAMELVRGLLDARRGGRRRVGAQRHRRHAVQPHHQVGEGQHRIAAIGFRHGAGVPGFADAVDRNGGDFANAKRLLDLGCGCGRMARHYPKFTNAEIFGCDYNRRLATWCQKNLPGTYFVNHLTPPLDVADEDFDLILLYSVFTHMRAETQALWLSELHRITAPGGYCVISIQDEDHINLAAAGLTPEQVQKDEFCIHNDTFEGSNRIATFQSREQVRKSFSRWFSVLDFVPGQPDSTDQTLVVLQKPAGS
mgnify:CR=1 FL=1